MPDLKRYGPIVLSGVLLLALAACAGTQRLAQYDFRGSSIAAVTIAPPHPEVLGGADFRVDGDDVLWTLIRVGSEVAREVEMQRFRTRLDAAALAVDVTDRISARTLDHAARYLRATPTDDVRAADYELEIRIRRYGIDARSWTSDAYFMVDAEMLLLDGRSGRRIWRTRVDAREPVGTRSSAGGQRSISNVLTALQLARMSTEEIERELENLADFTADRLTRALSRSLDRTRR